MAAYPFNYFDLEKKFALLTSKRGLFFKSKDTELFVFCTLYWAIVLIFPWLSSLALKYIDLAQKLALWPPNDPKMTWNELKGMKLTFKSYRPVFCSVPQLIQSTTSINYRSYGLQHVCLWSCCHSAFILYAASYIISWGCQFSFDIQGVSKKNAL